jgi:hypothetical protein
MREYLFHQKRFVYRDGDEHVYSFEHDCAGIDFYDEGGALRSIPKSTFGGFFLSPNATVEDVIAVLQEVDAFARQHNKSAVFIRSMPFAYNSKDSELIQYALQKSGYEILYEDVDFILKVKEPVLKSMNRLRRRQLGRAIQGGFHYTWLGSEHLTEVYSQLASTRSRKHYKMSMTLEEVANMLTLFPNEYKLGGVFVDNILAASVLLVVVAPEIWYVLYWGDHDDFRNVGAITFLANALVEEAYRNSVRILDLGTASHQGILNEGVHFFKTSLGAIPNKMISWKKSLSHGA